MRRKLLRAWDRFSLYLPTMLMALLALVTYWLVQITPSPSPPAAQKPARTDPDYFMKNFSVRTYHESGRLRSEVFGRSAKHFPADDVLEIEAVRIRSYDERGRLTTAVADRAITDSAGTEVQLMGKAVVVREPLQGATGRQAQRIEFRGEHLHAHIETERVVSRRPVEIRRGQEVFQADSLDFDNAQQWMQMQGRVRGTLTPRGAQP
jgi:lipopolysaccharide export system protein LptC